MRMKSICIIIGETGRRTSVYGKAFEDGREARRFADHCQDQVGSAFCEYRVKRLKLVRKKG
ncbi:MAG: hypothetical protein WC631_03215 [Candidatus Paceibacterota bacterium]